MENRIAVFFQSKPCLSAHVFALKYDPDAYIKNLQFLCRSGTFAIVSSAVRARIIAALHISSKHKSVDALLKHCEVTDICKAMALLDRPRQIRQLNQRIERIEERNPSLGNTEGSSGQTTDEDEKVKGNKKRRFRRKVDKYRRKQRAIEEDLCEDGHDREACLKAHEDSAVKELIQSASVSGALARKVRRWAKTSLPSDFLEFVMLALPVDPWKILADLVHFQPKDFSVPYFLDDIHRNKDKKDAVEKTTGYCGISMEKKPWTFVAVMRDLIKNIAGDTLCEVDQQFFDIADEFPQVYKAYSFVRTQPSLTRSKAIMEQFAAHAPLDTVIWYYEEFHEVSPENCESILSERVRGVETDELLTQITGTRSKATYGKLVERILTFRKMGLAFANDIIPVTEARLERLKSSWTKAIVGNSKVAVFGDASSSMQTAINAATIFAGMVSACFDGELSFFKSELVQSPHAKPGNAKDTLEVCDKILAEKSTANAACLWPYYKQKRVMDLFVMVTDEVENRFCHGHRFASLFAKYLDEMNPYAKLVVVCVGQGDNSFRQSFKSYGIEYKTVYIDDSRPDLAKFDALLGQLAMVASQDETSKRTPTRKATMVANTSLAKKISSEGSTELDLVFCVDNTGSMGSWILSAQNNIQRIIRDIVASEASDVRFALVSYRDHPPQDPTFVTRTHDFTDNVDDMQRWVDEMRAEGGGDAPEAVADGLLDCLNLSYRPNSTKIVVMIADAPPHGLGCCGDGFPKGCPQGHDPLEIVRALATNGITIYSVICGNFEGQAFYQGIAKMTGGQYIPISSAHLLAGVIIGGAQEEISLERLMQDAQDTIEAEEKAAGRELDDDELAARLQTVFISKRMKARRTQFGGADLPEFEEAAEQYITAETIADLRDRGSQSHLSLGLYGDGLDAAPGAAGSSFAADNFAEVSYAQCKRLAKKSKARKSGW
uniref:VWFA domain-containing protein n=1 Tax=Odontella aurita TaxID=265563 RepID=A0A6U6KJM2_9STRA|mmetsp:Transcript_59804/g.177240  ORF Transcript_59804/g.177240 Transcript_59804/m.177240 type:complete len:946 (+) Transcript_59804:291-3128(+)